MDLGQLCLSGEEAWICVVFSHEEYWEGRKVLNRSNGGGRLIWIDFLGLIIFPLS